MRRVMKWKSLALLCLAMPVIAAAAEEKAVGKCGCTVTLDAVIDAVETDYAGFQLKVIAERRERYERFKALLRNDAVAASHDRCAEILNVYTSFFQDHHVFVISRNKGEERVDRSARQWTQASARTEIERRRGNLDPIEGLWRSRQKSFFILHQPGQPAATFAAVALAANGAPSAEITAELRRDPSGIYRILYRDGEGRRQTWEATLHRGGALLEFATEGWARIYPAVDNERFDSVDPQAPVLARLDAQTLYLALPSFDARYAQPLNEIVRLRGEEIEKTHGLIVDLRGNAGGNAIYFSLARFFVSGTLKVSEDGLILASTFNLATLQAQRDSMGANGGGFDPVLKRMRENPGKLVPFLPAETYTPKSEEIAPGPRRIVVLVDRGVGSAAEAMVLHARQSSRVIVIGENTRGNIDYQQVSMRAAGCGEEEFYLGTPLFTRSRDLPNNALDGVGITPDIPLPADFLDPIAFSIRMLGSD